MLTSKNNGDDCISTSQLEECLEMFGLQPSRKDLEFLKKHMDVDGGSSKLILGFLVGLRIISLK